MHYHYVYVTPGQTVHLRSYPETNTSNVITELPRGQGVEILSTLSDWREIRTFDGIDTITGYIDSDFLTTTVLAVDHDEYHIPRYSTPAWKQSNHSGKYYLPVKRIQEDLMNLDTKYADIIEKADGYYGSKTTEAVKEFQKNKNLTVDGVFGTNSKKALWGMLDLKG